MFLINGLKSFLLLFANAFGIARYYGSRRLVLVFTAIVLQSILQVIGVGSIYPFLSFAADPSEVRNSSLFNYFPIASRLSDSELLLWTGIVAIAFLLLSNVANLASEVLRLRYTQGFGNWLRTRLLRKMSNLPYSYFLQHNTSELLKKVHSDVPAFTDNVLLPSLDVVARVLITLLLIGGLLLVSPAIALGATLSFGTFYVLCFVLLRGPRRRISAGLAEAYRGIYMESTQMLSGIKPVQIHNVQEYFLTRFVKHSINQARLSMLAPILSNSTRYLIEPVAFGGLVLLVLLMSRQQQSFTQIIPTIGVMALAAYRLLPALQGIYSQLSQISSHRYALNAVLEQLDFIRGRPPVAHVSSNPGETRVPLLRKAIVLERVTFKYPGAKEAVLSQLSVNIPARASIAITGRTGSGKSTLVDLLLGLHLPDAGEIRIDDQLLTSLNLSSWRDQIGYVPQDIFLLDDTISQNIAFGLNSEDIDLARLRAAAKRAQILAFIEDELTAGFETVVGERGVRLSGGQRQRIGLARALYRSPNILIMDEATSALDNETEAALVDAIEELHGNLTMIVVAHRLTTIQRCDFRLDLDAAGCILMPNVGAAERRR